VFKHVSRRSWSILLTLLVLLGATAALIQLQSNGSRGGATPARSQEEEAVINSLYAAEPGQGTENEGLVSREAFLQSRYVYPTGKADRAWLRQAAAYDKANIRSGVPGGQVIYNRAGSESPLTLDPQRWLSLGPKPQQSDGCEVCFSFGIVAGRVNDIVVVPMTPTIAFIASDGGGVWKTTNCCTQATTWVPVTDDPLISTVAIGDLFIDAGTSPPAIYAGTGDLRFGSFSFGSAGLLKSRDLGATWEVKGADVFGMALPQPPGQFPQYDSIGKVAVDPRNSNNLIVGTKTGVYFSYNAGDDWAGPCLPNPFPNQRQDITAVLAMTATGGLTDLFVAVGSRGYSTTVQYNLAENGANGIYRTTMPASGCPANWSLVSRSDNGWPAGTGSGIPQYQPGGNQVGRIDMAFAPSNPNVMYAEVSAINPGNGAIQRGGLLGIWRTANRGQTWTQVVTAHDLEEAQDLCGGTCVSDPLDVCGDVAQNWYDQHIAVDPNNPDVFFFDNVNLWRSTDGGQTVRDLTCGYSTINVPRPVHVDHHAITFMPGSSSQILIGSDGGVYYTPNGNAPDPNAITYVNMNQSLSTIEFYGGDISANFATSPLPVAVGGAQDNASSAWTGDHQAGPFLWQQQIGGDGMFARIEPVFGGPATGRVYMEAQNGAMRRSDDGAFGNYPILTVPTNYTVDSPRLSFIFPYEIYKGVPIGTPGGGEDCSLIDGCLHMIAGTYRVWENDDGARTPASAWVATSQDLTKNTLRDRSFINQLSYAYRTKRFAIAGTNDGNVAIGYNLHMRPAISSTWVNVTGGNTVLPNRPILDVALDPNVMMTSTTPIGYAAVGGFDQNTPSTPGHIFRVTCGLNCTSFTWENKSGNLPNIPFNAIAVNPRYPQQVFAGSDWGVYYTNDITAASPVWQRFNNGMPNVMIWDFSIDRGFTTLAAWTRSRGLFVWPLPAAPFVQTPTATVTGTPPTATRTPANITRTPQVPATYTQGPSSTATSTATARASATPLPCGTNSILFEGFESGTLGVFTTTGSTGPEMWRATTADARTGLWSAHVPNNGSIADQRMQMTNGLAIPTAVAGARLQFYHKFSFEIVALQFTYDGGVIEYSTDGGNTWVDAGPLITENGYQSVILGPDNPLQGRQGYGGESVAYPNFNRVTLNLDSLRGQTVKFRFRHGSDQNTGEDGWYVDDVLFYTTDPCASVTPGPSQTPGGATATRTIPAATQTPGGPTATRTGTAPAATSTSILPTITPIVPTATTAATQTPGGPSATPVPTQTLAPTQTLVPTVTPGGPTLTPVPPTRTATVTQTPPPTQTPGGPTATPEPTQTQTRVPTQTPGGPTPTACPIQFTDVPPDQTFYANIRCLACRGIISGYADGTFRPGNDITRGQIAKMVSNAAGFNDPIEGQTFEDVPPSNTFYEWIERLTRRGVMSGYPCGGPNEECGPTNRPYFRPFTNATRGQISKIVSNAAGFTEPVSGQFYTDVPPGSTFYEWIMRLTNRNVMSGYQCGGVNPQTGEDEPCDPNSRPYFRPNNNVTRGQASKIVANTFYPNCQTP
jgi:hypothetical protein